MVDGEVKLAYEYHLWHGDAKFSPTELVLHSPMVNYLFDEDDEEVVFVRQELAWRPPLKAAGGCPAAGGNCKWTVYCRVQGAEKREVEL